MKLSQGITERLKSESAFEWVQNRGTYSPTCQKSLKRVIFAFSRKAAEISPAAFLYFMQNNSPLSSPLHHARMLFILCTHSKALSGTLTVLWYLADIDTQAQERMERPHRTDETDHKVSQNS